jgi:hypothetical protein
MILTVDEVEQIPIVINILTSLLCDFCNGTEIGEWPMEFPKSTFLVFGATGRTGHHFVSIVLKEGHIYYF